MSGILTAKQEAFINEYLIDLNATQAAKRAGYSNKTANVQGAQNLIKLSAYIDKAKAERALRAGIDADRIALELAHIANDDIKNYLSFRTEKIVAGHDKETGEPIIEYQTILEMKDSDTIDTRNIQEISIGTKGEFKFKLYSKSDALVNLGKHVGMFTEKSEVNMTVASIEDYLKTIKDDD